MLCYFGVEFNSAAKLPLLGIALSTAVAGRDHLLDFTYILAEGRQTIAIGSSNIFFTGGSGRYIEGQQQALVVHHRLGNLDNVFYPVAARESGFPCLRVSRFQRIG